MGDSIWGWLAVLGAVIGYGTFGVPIKWKSVQAARVHPFVFQTYKSVWVFVTSWAILLVRPFAFTWWGVASGLCWVPAGAAYVVAVEHIGIGITQAIVSSLIILVATLWGTIFFHEDLKNTGLAALAFCLLAAGVATMSYFSVPDENKSHPVDEPLSISAEADRTEAIERLDAATVVAPLHEGLEEHKTDIALQDSERDSPLRNRSLGIAAAAFNGIWGGSVFVPMKIAAAQGAVTGADFVVSFGVGVALVTGGIWLLWVIWALIFQCRKARRNSWSPYIGLKGERKECASLGLPSLQFEVMALPGAIAGCLWSLGNFCAMIATSVLGEAVGYSSCQAAVMVSGLWGIFYFGEAPRGSIYFGLGALVCTSGIVLLSLL